jgi:hypothetical protein
MDLARNVAVALALSAALQTGLARAGEKTCLEAGSDQGVVQGRLGLLEGLGPAAFIVTVPGGICLKGVAKEDNVTDALSVQLFSVTADGFQDLYRMVGEKVYVRGIVSGTRTFQQKAPLIMEVIEIATN